MQRLPTSIADTQFEELMQDVPIDLTVSARACKAVTRSRKIKTPLQLLRLVLLYCGLDQALRTVAGNLTLLEERITDSSVHARLKACAAWIQALLPVLLPAPPLPPLPAGYRVVVVDGTTIEGPGAKGTWYRLHLRLELLTLRFVDIVLTDPHQGESLRHFAVGAGEIILADRGYCQPEALLEIQQAGAEWVVRWNSTMPLWARAGDRVALAATLAAIPDGQTAVTIPVVVGPARGSARLACTLHAYRLPLGQAEAARRRCRRHAQKKGKALKAATLYLAGWIVVVTTVKPAVWSAEVVLALYRFRWQVEVAIKRWKSILDIDQLRAKEGSTLAQVWLQGKLLYALLLERRARRLADDEWGYLDRPRHATWWRSWQLLKPAVAALITGVAYWQSSQWPTCIQVMQERPRRRQLQRLSGSLLRLLQPPGSTSRVASLLRLATGLSTFIA